MIKAKTIFTCIIHELIYSELKSSAIIENALISILDVATATFPSLNHVLSNSIALFSSHNDKLMNNTGLNKKRVFRPADCFFWVFSIYIYALN